MEELPFTGGLESLIETLARVLGEANYKLQVEIAATRARAFDSLEEIARTHSCDAVVLWGGEESTVELAPALWPQIDYDHVGMMRAAVGHLRSIGHSRIGYIGHDNNQTYARKLREGFALALAEQGLP